MREDLLAVDDVIHLQLIRRHYITYQQSNITSRNGGNTATFLFVSTTNRMRHYGTSTI
jgi:hypothetical protein